MTSKIPDLWSDDVTVDVLTPLAILRAQVQGLARRTQGLLEVEINSQEKANEINHWFDLVAPGLDGFRERILIVTHARDRVYPVTVEAACFLHTPTPTTNLTEYATLKRTAMTQEEFIDLVREALRSGEVRSSIQSLLARSNEVKRVSLSELPGIAETAPPAHA